MGAPTAFSDDADFLGMVTFPYPGEDPRASGLKIAHVIHKTYLDVDEIGSEAAAATAVVMNIIVSARRVGPPPPPPFLFRADKPFLFLLRDRRTGLILFMGRYVKPPADVKPGGD
jgi:serpin B